MDDMDKFCDNCGCKILKGCVVTYQGEDKPSKIECWECNNQKMQNIQKTFSKAAKKLKG